MPKKYDFENQKYSEEGIRNYIEIYPEKCDWYFWDIISYYQDLSEDFIREFQDKVDWGYILRDQKLSEKFLIEFIDKIEIFWLGQNQEIPEKIKNNIINLKKVQNA